MNIKSCCGCPEGKEIIYCGCDCHKEQENSLWEDDKIQFARLINELDLLDVFNLNTLISLACAMDLSQTEVLDLIERAKNFYDKTLEQL